MNCICFGTSAVDRRKGEAQAEQKYEGHSLGNINHISYGEVKEATNNFHPTSKIGRGGFGTVYKGILKNGRQVAVKTLSAQSKQGIREFLSEINTLANVRHPNLVELFGCCIHGSSRILIYEYLENSSLDRALLVSRSRTIEFVWERRSAICLGTARGLVYLHEELVPRIVHRDIKASNILLDADFTPKIGDFGLAKLFPDDITHISTKIAGTTGYLAPEYVLGGQLTMKADVYSFGILILEIVSGQSCAKANWGGRQVSLVEWAWQLYKEAKLLELVDPELGDFPQVEVLRYIKVAFFCIQAVPNHRPTMSQVVEMLSRDVHLNEGWLTPPGFFDDFSGQPSNEKSSDESSTTCQASFVPITITQLIPR